MSNRPRYYLVTCVGGPSYGDELITARCDLALCASFKTTVFDFARHRRPEHYRLIVDRAGAIPPPEA